jgi:hypothetical protein
MAELQAKKQPTHLSTALHRVCFALCLHHELLKLGLNCLRLIGKPSQERRAQYSQMPVKNQLLNCCLRQMC